MPPHGKTDHNGEQHGQRHCQQIAAGCNGANEHQLIHFYGQDDEPVQRHAQQQAHAGADEGQKLDLAEDVAVHFFVIETQHLDGGKLLFALGKVDAD